MTKLAMTPGEVVEGDCVEVMASWPQACVDAICCDPPYGLEFMGRSWDGADGFRRSLNAADVARDNVFGRQSARGPEYRATPLYQEWTERWSTEALRVAKPGAYLLAFGGTRTVHRLACAIEDAGWIIRDTLVWAYAQGFPKSKANLKPAWEPIIMARKPGPLRELAIDACRIPTYEDLSLHGRSATENGWDPRWSNEQTPGQTPGQALGRWPANVILTADDEGRAIFDGGWEGVVGGGEASRGGDPSDVRGVGSIWHDGNGVPVGPQYGDTGTYSRFFLLPKADRADREPVLGGLPEQEARTLPSGYATERGEGWRPPLMRRNHHPTVKPTELMRHLVRLVTPTGGVVCDPFLGSGTTAIAAEMEGFAWVGIEREAEYVAIARARLNGTQRGLGLAG